MAAAKPRYLTKSRYKLAVECPTKLFYTGKPNVYADSTLDDPFLEALARGGFQVGALAQCLYAGGTEVKAKRHDDAVRETDELLQAEDVTIYEAAFRHGSLFARVDVAVKHGNTLRLLEVKAKSFDPDADDPFVGKRDDGKLKSEYAPYLYDVAFQAHVVRQAKGFDVLPRLVFANKRAKARVDGLNQLFLIRRDGNGGSQVIVKRAPTADEIGGLLVEVDVSRFVTMIHESRNRERSRAGGGSFHDEVELFARQYAADQRMASEPGRHCKHCQFRAESERSESGFRECWTKEGKVAAQDAGGPFVFDVWNIHYTKSDALIAKGTPLMRDVTREDLATKGKAKAEDERLGLSPQERQWLQVEAVGRGVGKPHIDRAGISRALSAWIFPFHFIDFETAATAIPFSRGMRPYEAIAFQFSHHVVHRDGRIEHAGEYIHDDAGAFPNFAFVRALKAELEKDNGTIFRYAAHENTILCRIHAQLQDSHEPDKDELMSWIETITDSPRNSTRVWAGPRAMVDLREIVKAYLYLPEMGGSISIKKVLPAVLRQTTAFRTRFEAPVYGAKDGITSRNYRDWSWIRYDEHGAVVDPYKLLEPVFKDVDVEKLDLLTGEDDELADGGAAMTAFAMMQFTEMSQSERDALRSALLRYCELDTLAMVFLYEYLREVSPSLGSERRASAS